MMTKAGKETIKYINKQNILNFFRKKDEVRRAAVSYTHLVSMQDLMIEWKDDGSHLYEQIYSYIKDEIRKGKLLYQEKIPSTRSLAQYLQVSRSTVELAYEQLLSEGYIESVPYKGYFAAKVEELYRLDGMLP